MNHSGIAEGKQSLALSNEDFWFLAASGLDSVTKRHHGLVVVKNVLKVHNGFGHEGKTLERGTDDLCGLELDSSPARCEEMLLSWRIHKPNI